MQVFEAQGHELIKEPVAGNDHTSAVAAIHDWFAAHIGSEAGFADIGSLTTRSTRTMPVARCVAIESCRGVPSTAIRTELQALKITSA